jgi:hypothetical protein
MAAMAAQYRQTKAERAELADTIPADLLALYDKIRAGSGGIGAAQYTGDRCGACQLTMIPADLVVVKSAPIDEVLRCEECGRILVRAGMLQS